MKTLVALMALAVCQLASAQKTVELKSFDNLAVSGGIDLKLVKSSDSKLVIESGDTEDLDISNEEGYLALSATGPITATVYYDGSLEGIAASAGVEMRTEGTITSSNCSVSAGAGVELHLTVDVEDLNVAIASGSEVHLSGKAKKNNAAVASGAELNADKLAAKNAAATVASGGEASIHATGVVDATVASGGELKIYGNPEKVNQVVAHGGELTVMK